MLFAALNKQAPSSTTAANSWPIQGFVVATMLTLAAWLPLCLLVAPPFDVVFAFWTRAPMSIIAARHAASSSVVGLRCRGRTRPAGVRRARTGTATMKLPDEDDIDAFLDTPFYDPDKVLDDENSTEASKTFARFVKNDYETAEALLAGGFFVVLVVIAQELLRLHIHGDQYVPFTAGGSSGGRLF